MYHVDCDDVLKHPDNLEKMTELRTQYGSFFRFEYDHGDKELVAKTFPSAAGVLNTIAAPAKILEDVPEESIEEAKDFIYAMENALTSYAQNKSPFDSGAPMSKQVRKFFGHFARWYEGATHLHAQNFLLPCESDGMAVISPNVVTYKGSLTIYDWLAQPSADSGEMIIERNATELSLCAKAIEEQCGRRVDNIVILSFNDVFGMRVLDFDPRDKKMEKYIARASTKFERMVERLGLNVAFRGTQNEASQ